MRIRGLICCALLSLTGCSRPLTSPKVLVLGFDGCDPKLLRRWIDQGKLPNFKRLEQLGGLWKLGTTTPPQSPVAWATFVTGLDPAEHGIFDFIHRDLKTMQAVPSLTAVEAGHSKLLRGGRPFWSELEEHHVPATLLKVPANFPPSDDDVGTQLLTGMGTPDLLGSYGLFTYYHEGSAQASLQGGQDVPVEAVQGQIRARFIGPENQSVAFSAWVNPIGAAALVQLSSRQIVLKHGEWSEWLPLKFPSAQGMVRLYLKSVRPFQLYASPINIDPVHPVQAISAPESYSAHLSRLCGPFYTQGMAEDSKALGSGVLDDEAYLQQSETVFQDTRRLLEQGLAEYRGGYFFGYLSSTDLQSHLYWNTIDPQHPGYTEDKAKAYGRVIEDTYIKADGLIGKVFATVDPAQSDTYIFVLSDHGFAPFRRSFDLNDWLRQQKWLTLEPGRPLQEAQWKATQAYGVGFNGLYLNLQGRETQGTVLPARREALLKEISQRLLQVRDPKTGETVVLHVYPQAVGPHQDQAPDLIVGYRSGYRGSWETALGQTRETLLQDNLEHWSGDHLIDPTEVPGVLLCNHKLRLADPQMRDMAPTFLQLYKIRPPQAMTGRNLLEE